MTIALDIQAVSKRFGALTALDQVSLSVEAGEFFALLGPNGAGKTTTFYMIVGLEKPDAGQVLAIGCGARSLVENSPFGGQAYQIGTNL